MFHYAGLLSLTLLVVLAMLFLIDGPARAGEQQYTLQEPLNRKWTHELVTYPFQAPKGQCVPDSLAVTGPAGAIPVQLESVELWPGTTTVKSARLSFIVEELAPQTSLPFRVSYGTQPTAGAKPASDLKLQPVQGGVEVSTSRFGARLLIGEKNYETPAAPADVPAPVMALRLADDVWSGGSRLYGATGIKSWSSRLTAQGPVFARVETVYTYADGAMLTVNIQLNAGDYALQFAMDVKGDHPDDGWELLMDGIKEGVKIAHSRNYAKEMPFTLDAKSKDPACYLCPWPGDAWFAENPALLRLKLDGRPDELQLSIRDSGAWVPGPARQPWTNFSDWGVDMVPRMWSGFMGKRLPLLATDTGVSLRCNLLAGQRKWTLGRHADAKLLFATYQNRDTGLWTPLPRLNEVKDMLLDWRDGSERRPFLFLSGAEIEASGLHNAAALRDLRDVDKLRAELNMLGNFDLMRAIMEIAARYDAVIDSPQITPQERKLFKAQMAYLGYMVADPLHWSYERGYASGNPNMTVSRIANLGLLGLAIRDNPQGKQWAQYAIDWAKYWLAETVDDKGYWPESSHYARVSWADLVQLAIGARKAGMYDFFVDPKFKAMAHYYEKTLTPPDPLRHVYNWTPAKVASPNPRVNTPYGRGTRGDAWGLGGLVARATAASDPEFSREMQWSWRSAGYPEFFSHSTAGLGSLYVNRDLPAQRPNWNSEFFPHVGYLLRSHLGDPRENYLFFIAQPFRNGDGEIWPADTGSISKWFAYGKPMGGLFHRIPESSHVLLESRVMLATNWDPAAPGPDSGYVTKAKQDAFTVLPHVDYVSTGFTISEIKPSITMPKDAPAFPKQVTAGTPPFQWQRQILSLKNETPDGVQYLVLRDTVRGNQPTQWHFWSLSEKIGAPAEVADRAAFLRDKPGAKTAPARELKGDRFTAAGQWDVDLEYYIASPTNTPRYTLRYGQVTGAYGVSGNFKEFQDLLQLRLPGDGSYFVALFPHDQREAAPAFSTLGNGTVIRAVGAFGTDYAFLSEKTTTAIAADAAFTGTAAAVQDRATGLTLLLAAPGSVDYREFSLSVTSPATMRIAPYALTLTLPANAPAGSITLKAPGAWVLAPGATGATLTKKSNRYTLTLPAGTQTVTLVKKG